MASVYTAAEATITTLSENLQNGQDASVTDLSRMVNNSYLLFCTLSTNEAIDTIKNRLYQLIIEFAQAGKIQADLANRLQSKLNQTYIAAREDVELPTGVAFRIKCLLETGTLGNLDYEPNNSLLSVATLFAVPILLKTYAVTQEFKSYLYAVICNSYSATAGTVRSADGTLQLAIHLGVLAGVYTLEQENILLSSADGEDFMAACHQAIFLSGASGTSVFKEG